MTLCPTKFSAKEIEDIRTHTMTERSEIQWRRVNSESFEYAIQQGPHGDEFVKLLDGFCLRRPRSLTIQEAIDAYDHIEVGHINGQRQDEPK